MTIDPRSDRPVYRQVADVLREDIVSGRLGPGSALPSEGHVSQQYGIGREAVRQAFAILRGEGLIITERGTGSYVRDTPQRRALRLKRGEHATVRMPTEPERRSMDIHEGIPLLEIHHVDGTIDTLPGDSVEIIS